MQNNSKIISRLTALWALTEAGLGGVLHAVQSPFTGLLVGGFATILVSLIAYFSQNRWETILRSLLVVLVIKVAVSPHSPVTSYLAVGFQALVGAAIFSRLKINMWSTMLLGVLTLVESAIQKLLALWLIFGRSFWVSISEFSEYVSQNFTFLGGVLSVPALVSAYLWIYVLLGIIIGYIVYDMILYLEYNKGNIKYQIQAIEFDLELDEVKKRRGRWRMWVILGAFLAMIIAYYFFTQEGNSVWQNWLYVSARSVGILLVWYYLLGPVIRKWLMRFLEGKQHRVQKEIDETLTLLPYLSKVSKLAWKENKEEKGYARWKGFMGDAVLYSIHLHLE